MTRRIILSVTLALILVVCLFFVYLNVLYDPAKIMVTNEANTALSDVILSGRGFSKTIALLGPGRSFSFRIHRLGETGVAVKFTANGTSYQQGEQGYFEGSGGYRVSVVVTPNLEVQVSTTLATPFVSNQGVQGTPAGAGAPDA